MRLSSIFAVCSVVGSAFAAPLTSSSQITKRNENGHDVIDFDFVLNTIKEIDQRYSKGEGNALRRRDDTDFISTLMQEFSKNDLLGDFIGELTNAPHLKEAVQKGALSAISSGMVNETVLLNSLRGSNKLSTFFDTMLKDEELNDELYHTAKDILGKVDKGGQAAKRDNVDSSSPFIRALYSQEGAKQKRDVAADDVYLQAYGMSKRDLIDTVVNIVKQITNTDFVQDIVRSILGDKSLIEFAIDLLVKVFNTIDWSALYNTIKDSGFIQTIFKFLMNFVTGLFDNGTLGKIIDELFGNSGDNENKTFLSRLLSVGVEIGGELFRSLTKSDGLLSELAKYLFGEPTDGSGNSSSGGGGLLSAIFGGLFGGSDDSGSNNGNGNSGSESSGGSGKGIIGTLIDSLFGGGDSDDSGNNSGGGIGSVIDNLFDGNDSGSSSSGSSSTACCCSPEKIKKRALKRALTKKMKRSVKRSLLNMEDLEFKDGLMNFYRIK